jgi:hypothetical protein
MNRISQSKTDRAWPQRSPSCDEPHEMVPRLVRRIMRLVRARRVGVALIGVGLVPVTCWTVWSLTRTWRPVDMPISLSQGSHFSTGEFPSNLDAEFAIDIDSENKIRSDELGCLLGNGMRSTCPSPSVVRVRWSLYSDGTVLQGTSDDNRGSRFIRSVRRGFSNNWILQGPKGSTL